MSVFKSFDRQFWLLCASSFLFFGSFNLIIPELPTFLEAIGGAAYEKYYIAIFALAALLSRPFSGILTDRIGRIPIMVFGSLVCFVMGFSYLFVHTIGIFLLVRFLHGMSTGFKPTATVAIIADMVPPQKRGIAMGMSGTFGSMGMAIGPYIGSSIAQKFGTNAMFITSSVLALLSIIILMGIKETLPNKQAFKPRHLLFKANEIIDLDVWKPALIMLLVVFSFGTILTVFSDFSTSFGLENKGILFSVITFSSLSMRLLAGTYSDRLGRIRILSIGTLILTISLINLALAQSLSHVIISTVLFGIAFGINSPTIFAYAGDLVKEHKRGQGFSTVFIALEIGIILGSYIGGAVYNNNQENFRYSFIIAAIMAAFACLMMIFSKSRNK